MEDADSRGSSEHMSAEPVGTRAARPGEERPLGQTRDSEGRTVVLDEEGWAHILHEHPELAPYREEIMLTVSSPDQRCPDPRPGRERCYRRNLGPSRWLFVVVQCDETPARVVTAYANRKDPPGPPSQ